MLVIRGLFCFPVGGTVAQIFSFSYVSRLWLYLLATSTLHSFSGAVAVCLRRYFLIPASASRVTGAFQSCLSLRHCHHGGEAKAAGTAAARGGSQSCSCQCCCCLSLSGGRGHSHKPLPHCSQGLWTHLPLRIRVSGTIPPVTPVLPFLAFWSTHLQDVHVCGSLMHPSALI